MAEAGGSRPTPREPFSLGTPPKLVSGREVFRPRSLSGSVPFRRGPGVTEDGHGRRGRRSRSVPRPDPSSDRRTSPVTYRLSTSSGVHVEHQDTLPLLFVQCSTPVVSRGPDLPSPEERALSRKDDSVIRVPSPRTSRPSSRSSVHGPSRLPVCSPLGPDTRRGTSGVRVDGRSRSGFPEGPSETTSVSPTGGGRAGSDPSAVTNVFPRDFS